MRVWLPALALLLAGCSSPPAQQADEPAVITDPNDYGYLQNATAGSHVHDYWQGRTEVEVLNADSGGGSVTYGSDHGTVSSFAPPDGSIVPQGTGVLEATLDWTEDDGASGIPDTGAAPGTAYTRVELWVRTAADAEPHFVQVVEKGVPFRFNSTNEQDDPPHYTVSLWEFSVVLWNEGGQQTSFTGFWHLRVAAFRTLPLVVFPPHPDLWNGASELPLHAFDMAVQLHTGLVLTYSCFGGCADVTFRPDDGALVPFDASTVEVTVTTDLASTPVPFALQVHGADTRDLHDVPASSDTPGKQVFTIDVAPGVGDSPYAKQSLWEFRVHMSTMDQGAWTGTYHVESKVVR